MLKCNKDINGAVMMTEYRDNNGEDSWLVPAVLLDHENKEQEQEGGVYYVDEFIKRG